MTMLRKKIISVAVVAVLLCISLCAALAGCKEKTNEKTELIKSSDIAYLDEIKESGNLTFEWLKPYSASKPTAIIMPGESDGRKFSMTLDDKEYTFKSELLTTGYTVEKGIGYKAQGLNLDLSYYWLNVSEWNVAIFHWESFAVENKPEDVVAKFYSLPKMRYYKGEGSYETTKVPHNNLTEITASLYYEEMKKCYGDTLKGAVNGKEIRFIGNGVGADLALSVASYLNAVSAGGSIDKNYLPTRIALCDPYMSIEDMHMPDNKLPWTGISTTDGMIKVVDGLLTEVTDYGAVVEMIETEEVKTEIVDNNGQSDTKKTYSYAYNIEKSEKAEESYKSIKNKVAHLTLSESYSVRFSEEYKSLKRTALDWYLYSIVGSDDADNTAGGEYSIGYPKNLGDFQTYYTYDGFNWGKNMTRPIMNNRALNNDSNSGIARSRGKNFGVSAWTPTVYTRALKGITFTLQKKAIKNSIGTDIHGNYKYSMADYVMPYFRSENFQKSNQENYTLICGYVYTDVNKDGFINDGFAGLADAKLNVKVTTGDKTTTVVAEFSVNADKNGFYVIKFDDKTKDSEGALSKAGYSFSTEHKVEISFVPTSHDYYGIADVTSGIYYDTVGGHNFKEFTTTVTMNGYYADAITVANCLVRANG